MHMCILHMHICVYYTIQMTREKVNLKALQCIWKEMEKRYTTSKYITLNA